MVKSKLNDKIDYEEKQTIEDEDRELEISAYSIVYNNVKCIISLGSIKKTYDKYGILYVPIYLALLPSENTIQIGVYEFKTSRLLSLTDVDGDLHLAFMGKPLLYGFVDEGFLKEKLIDQYDNNLWNSLIEAEDNEYVIGDEIASKSFVKSYENEELDNLESKQPSPYNQLKSGNWVQSFMKNNRYKFIRVPGDGDCFFTTIKLGYESIKISLPVNKLRDLVSNDINQSHYDNYKEFYDLYNKEVDKITDYIRSLKTKFDIIKKNLKKVKGVDTQKYNSLREKAKEIMNKHSEAKKEKAMAEDNLSDVSWFKNIKSLKELKEYIKKSEFWADELTITKLEYLINTKIIILSKDNETVNCGLVDERITKENKFNPMYYLIVSHTKEGSHYDLVGYQYPEEVKKIFRFHELPFDIKEKIVETCMKKGETLYTYIPLFKKLIAKKDESNNINESKEIDETMGDGNYVGDGDDGDSSKPGIAFESEEKSQEESQEKENQEKTVEEFENKEKDKSERIGNKNETNANGYTYLNNETKDDLYDDAVVFQFYSKSNKKPYPGKGSGETIPDNRKGDFDDLSKITDWRKMLSNMYISPFELDGLQWNSVEHYYHANKFKNNPDFYKKFSLNSKSIISEDPFKAKTAGGPTGKVDGKRFRPKDVIMNEEFIKNERSITMEKAQKAKYTQNEQLKNMLLATKDAKLVHKVRNNVEIFYETMNVRENLKKMTQ